MSGLTDQVAQVGTELKIELDGTDADGSRLTYDYHAPDVMDLAGHAQLTVAPSGAGVFRWTPTAQDIGKHPFDFIASNGGQSTTVTITIEVKSGIGSATAPIFRQPLGTGTTIDMSRAPCLDLDVVIDDQASTSVTIGQEEPVIEGAKLTAVDGMNAKWHWCPTAAQKAADDRYTLVLSADDGQNAKTTKPYLIVLRNTSTTCAGSGPMIYHTAANHTTRLDLPITARFTDTVGLKDAPLLYYSLTDPGATPDTSTMIQLTTTKQSGDNNDGTWTSTVPNPVASAADGATASVYYVFAADDHDATNNCDHVTQSPIYHMTITAGGTTTAGLCSPCTADSQCGAGNECVYMGSMGDSYCTQACGTGCPTGYSCSNDTIFSVDYASARQCIPQSGSCSAPTGACQDDMYSPNDTQSAATANGAISLDSHDLVSCPNPNSTTRMKDDWFKIVLPAQSNLDIYLTGDGSVDLDLHLYHSDGTVVDASIGSTDIEELHKCLPGLTYYVKVNGYGYARDAYYLDFYTTAASSCP